MSLPLFDTEPQPAQPLAEGFAMQVERWALAQGDAAATAARVRQAAHALSLATGDGHVCLPLADLGCSTGLRRALLGSRDEVFDTFVKLHPLLKESFFLQTKEDDNDPYESSQFSVVIANASGIFGLYSYREVFEFKEFWGIGSGRGFALGAMHAVWDKARTAREVALAGIHAGCEFDRSSAGPVDIYTIKLKT